MRKYEANTTAILAELANQIDSDQNEKKRNIDNETFFELGVNLYRHSNINR